MKLSHLINMARQALNNRNADEANRLLDEIDNHLKGVINNVVHVTEKRTGNYDG